MKPNTTVLWFGLAALLLVGAQATADDAVDYSIVEISPGFGYYEFDSSRGLEDREIPAIGLGLFLSRRWATLLHYSAIDRTRDTAKIQKYHVDALRFFNTDSRWRPYLVFGYGQIEFNQGPEDRIEGLWNGGLGLYHRLSSKWSLRGDWRIFASASEDAEDRALTISVGYRFGQGESDN